MGGRELRPLRLRGRQWVGSVMRECTFRGAKPKSLERRRAAEMSASTGRTIIV